MPGTDVKKKRRHSRRPTPVSKDSGGGTVPPVHPGDLPQAATLKLEIAPKFNLDEFTETEWSAFMGLAGPPDTRP